MAAVLGLWVSLPHACAQMSLETAVDLALGGNPRVRGAQADVERAKAQLSEAHDVYVPSIIAGAALGQAYGYSPYPPTLFNVNSSFLAFGPGQSSYIRSARSGLNAALLALEDVREQVAEDTALAYLALDHDQQREEVVRQQLEYAGSLVTIVQERADAGQDSRIELTRAKLTAAQLRLGALRAQDDTAVDREHLARLIGRPPAALRADDTFPATPVPLDADGTTVNGYASPAVASAFANAEAKRLQAKGDSRYRFWPRVSGFGQYNRYATFSDSFAQTQKLYQFGSGSNTTLSADEAAFGVQIAIPMFDKSGAAKARESAAEASRALHDAENAQIEALDGQTRTRHTIDELKAQADVAGFQQQYAQQQLEVLQVQLQAGNPNGPQMTPKDEQNALITERDKYLGVIDAGFQLRQAEIQLLRQTGGLEMWLKAAANPAPAPVGPVLPGNLPAAPHPHP